MFKKSNYRGLSLIPCVVLLLAGLTGCQIFPDRPEWSKKLLGKEEEAVVPTRMMVMWADTVLHQPQKSGVRGFGARIYFYSDDSPNPVKVDGGLAVYAFDADEINPSSAKPKRKFVFTADQFAEHMSHTSMGTSYSVWCPWDEVGGYNERLSLIVRFEGRSGGVVISDSTTKLLPGLNRPASSVVTQQKHGTVAQAAGSDDIESSTQLAGYEKASSGSSAAKTPRRQTETIDLPPSFYRHLKGPAEPLGGSPAFFGPALLGTQSDASDAKPAEPKERAGSSEKTASHRASYLRRTVGDKQLDAALRDTGQDSMPSGWIPQLPKTPRYGFPASPPQDGAAP